LATNDDFMDEGQKPESLPGRVASPDRSTSIQRGHQILGGRAYQDLVKSSDRRQKAISRLDKIEFVILALAVVSSLSWIGLTALAIWLNHPSYYLGSVAGGALAAVFGSIKIGLNKQRMLLMEEEEKYENCLRILEAAGLVDDPQERMRIISRYAAALTQDVAEGKPTGATTGSAYGRRRQRRARP
jgi:hypothetical protein